MPSNRIYNVNCFMKIQIVSKGNKMKSLFFASMMALLLCATNPIGSQTKTIDITLSDSLELGCETFLFSSISSVCEDSSGNFYVVDALERKVFKFDLQGNLVLSFGQKGQGPGDFQSPSRIILTQQGWLAVCEDMYDISFHQPDGEFIKRIHLSNRLSTGYVGEQRYYAWIWEPEVQQQVMVDPHNHVTRELYAASKNEFSVSAPDETGRMVMFNYSSDVYAPSLLFSHHSSISAVAKSTVYDIILLDSKGKEIHRLKRDIQPPRISRKEKNHFKNEIKQHCHRRGWPLRISNELFNLIPKHKAFFNHICLSNHYAFVFRIPQDITKPQAPVFVDIFSLSGDFLGTAELFTQAVFISKKHMYFIQTNPDGNVCLLRKSYQIDFNQAE
ncbi:MAG: 6-bladed beta-propeller [Candidatus Aminicenantes bacterium]|nr:6-bladed beta-propeller [Candidatus Aminicenantes bacterium]